LSSANSINIGRLVPQVAYYFKAYGELLNKNEIKMGDKVNFVVPTGNFGDILAGYIAKKMGLPVGKLVCASNTNKVLTDFFESGVYNKNRSFYITKSPSMDILISSNLERLLYLTCGDVKCAEYMAELKANGEYKLNKEELDKIRAEFDAGYCDDTETVQTIEKVYNEYGYLMDTHTAVASHVYEQYVKETGDTTKTVIASTASPYKFSASVLEAMEGKASDLDEYAMVDRLAELSGYEIPASLAALKTKEIRFSSVITKEEQKDYVLKELGI
jgi:threonine synthase